MPDPIPSITSFTPFGIKGRWNSTAENSLQTQSVPFDVPTDSFIGAQSVEDDFFHPKNSLTAGQVLAAFSAGLGAALLLLNIRTLLRQHRLFANAIKKAVTDKTAEAPNTILPKNQIDKLQLNISSQFGGDNLSPSYRIASMFPEMRPAVASYIGTMILGYLGGSIVTGLQEAWVRRQETLIRANLINKLQTKFRQSIQVKQDMDTVLRRQAELQIYQILRKQGISKQVAHNIVIGMPIIEPSDVQRLYAYYPISRTLTSEQLKTKPFFGFDKKHLFGVLTPPHTPEAATVASSEPASFKDQLRNHKLLNLGLLGLGALAGGFVHQFSKLFSKKSPIVTMIPPKTVTTEFETMLVGNLEAWWLKSFGKRDQMMVLAGFFGMTALAKMGKLFIDGVRSVEVTRQNARTEFLYQTHNWLMQDPSFHKIAEEEAVKHELALLKEQLPYLLKQPEKLQERILVILSNIGRNSAPKYFPMTPAVNLVDARS